MDELACVVALFWMLSVGVAASVGSERGRAWTGAGLGFLMGPLGVIAAGLLPRTPRKQAEYELNVDKARKELLAEATERKRRAAELAEQRRKRRADREAQREAEQWKHIPPPTREQRP